MRSSYFFDLSWQLLRSFFMCQEALERETSEMRRQIAELKAEAARADGEDKGTGRSERHLLAIVFCFDLVANDYWRITGATRAALCVLHSQPPAPEKRL